MRVMATIALAAVLALPVSAQQQAQPQQQQTPQAQESQRPAGTAGAMATVEAIVDNPERFYNETVTVSGEVGDVLSKQAFNIQEKGIIDIDDRLLVLSKKQLTNLTEDSVVRVRGKVRPLVKADIERELGISDWTAYGIDADFFSKNERRPVLIAESVDVQQSSDKK